MSARDRWDRVERLYHAALALDPNERATFLRETCSDEGLRQEVESLLSYESNAPEFLKTPAVEFLAADLLPADKSPGLADRRFGQYEILSLLGTGGMGEVFRARDATLHRDVALKMLPAVYATDPQRRARFEREARLLASLNHPHIAAIYGFEQHDGVAGLILELVEGETLAARLRRGALPVREALAIARQIADALAAAHARGIVHRDLKPANITIAADGRVKVLDFGLAKATVDTARGDTSPTISMGGTQPGVILGTAAYMSPEQARGKPVDKRADVWAFGCVLWEMLTGRMAFGGETTSHSILAVLDRTPDWRLLPETAPPAVVRLLQRCLEKDPERRLNDIADARIEIDDARGELEDALTAPPAQPSHALGPIEAPRRRERLAWGLTALSTVAFVAVLAMLTLNRESVGQAPVRFEIPTPSTVQMSSLAVSSDGRQLAFVATIDGTSRLWIRSLDQVTARPLASTDGARHPSWAPDGTAIAFFARGKLKQIDVRSGAIQTLADAEGWGAAWNTAGTIIFAPRAGGPLFRIATSGGEATPVTQLRPGTLNHAWPQFLPDGRRFLFYQVGDPGIRGTYLASLDGEEPRRVLAGDSVALFAEPGALVFLREGQLMAVRFNPSESAVSGNPMPIADGLGPPLRFRGAFAVSAAGTLAFRAKGGEPEQQLAWVDRSGTIQTTLGPRDPLWTSRPELAPDGKRVAIERALGEAGLHVYVLSVDGGVPSLFTFSPNVDWAPVWSPDGRQIVFASDRNGLNDLFEKPSNGTANEQPLLITSQNKVPQSWTSDGRFLLYTVDDPKTRADVWALPMTGDRKPFPVVQSAANEAAAQVSPDGKWMAYQSDESGISQIYVRSFASGGGKWQVSATGGSQPRWRPDGQELFYIASDASLMAVPIGVIDEAIRFGEPLSLFATPAGVFDSGATAVYSKQTYTVAGDGRFLMNVWIESRTPPPITVVLNWLPQLNRR